LKLLFLLRDVSFIVEHPSKFVPGEYFDMIRQLFSLSLAVACVAISGCEKDASTAVVVSSDGIHGQTAVINTETD